MALFLAPRTLVRYSSYKKNIIRNLSEIKQSHGRGGTCSVPEPPECPPCEPAQRPACRPSEPAHGPRGLRRVCCAPSSGQRPPCMLTPTVCPKTCRHANKKKVDYCDVTRCRNEQHEKCGDNLDRVARRLAAAELTRRLDYESELSEEKALPISDPIAFNLMDERECMRATDGNDYTTSKQPITQSGCGPCRTPPLPCPVHLDSDDHCKISSGQHLKPCAHRPRIFLEIDRSQNAGSIDKPIVSPLIPVKDRISTGSTSFFQPSTSGSLTTRIIESFKSSKGSCPRRSCKPSCTHTKARYAGDTSWCTNIPSPAPVPANCKEPSLTERLRRRSGALCSKPCGTRHRIHTKTCNGQTTETMPNTENLQGESNINKLENILSERSKLKEAGLGRVVVTQQQIKKTNPLGAGLMELQIPPTSDLVRVRVSLNFDNSKSTICETPSTSHIPISQNLSSCNNDSNASWLSIKNLQKKFTGCSKNGKLEQAFEKTTAIGIYKPKSQCSREATKEPCTLKRFGEIGPTGEGSKCPVPLTHGAPKSMCRGHLQQEPQRCSLKQHLLNSV